MHWRPLMHWYMIRGKHRNEDFFLRQLQGRGMEAYFPCIRQHSSSPSARKVKPYFPGYLFMRTELDKVGISSAQWIRERVDQVNISGLESWQNLKPGDDNAIRTGPFAGYRGIFSYYLSDRRLILFLKFVRAQQVRVELPAGQINAIKHFQAWQ
jgi:hypothetical protein